jgi:hypothetical protein
MTKIPRRHGWRRGKLVGARDTTCLEARVHFYIYKNYGFFITNYLQVNYNTTTTMNVPPIGLETRHVSSLVHFFLFFLSRHHVTMETANHHHHPDTSKRRQYNQRDSSPRPKQWLTVVWAIGSCFSYFYYKVNLFFLCIS